MSIRMHGCWMDGYMNGHTDRQIDSQAKADRQRGREAEREREREIHIHK